MKMTVNQAKGSIRRTFNAMIDDWKDNQSLPTDKTITILADSFYQRDRDQASPYDIEGMAVMRGIIQGMQLMRQIIEGGPRVDPEEQKEETN